MPLGLIVVKQWAVNAVTIVHLAVCVLNAVLVLLSYPFLLMISIGLGSSGPACLSHNRL